MSVIELTVRPAEMADHPHLVEGNQRLAWETERKRLDPDVVAAGVRRLLEDPYRGQYFLAISHGRVAGQMLHTREWSDWRNGDFWWLQSVYVWPEFREKGVFRALYRHVEDLARHDPDVVGLRLYVEHHNQSAIETYHRLGMVPAGYQVMESVWRDVPALETGGSLP